MPERRYRDPVHNIICLNSSQSADALLIELIDSKEFQRLRRIKQLGLALYTYQGAEHSRFTHSLGVMHVVTRALSLLDDVPEQVRLVARVAALLHDIGHGPFSHVIEKATGLRHELWTEQILLDPQTQVCQILTNFDPALPRTVVSVYKHDYVPTYACQLVSSQLDCDRFDYLLRDSLMTGAKYGNYDLEWVLHSLKLSPDGQLYVSAKGIYAVEEYLQARFYMFRQVYFHHSLRAVENMLIAIMRRARVLAESSRLNFLYWPLGKLLTGQQMTTAEYLLLDDHDLMYHIKRWVDEPDPVLADLCTRFLNRKLFRSVDLPQPVDEELVVRARAIVRAAGFDEQYYLLRDSAADVPYFGPYEPKQRPQSKIYVEAHRRGQNIGYRLCEITEVSEVVRNLRSFTIERLCFPKEVSEKIYALLPN
ncbi:MAG: HD domain-containing protein [Acidobacteriota bacterium]|nr:HD domain-containing protein [Blastocatellia bacterium]MDW8412102.1 HD domain-containing protein [Acidobacteriota bacterium]